jgi:dienelactone hydrolase
VGSTSNSVFNFHSRLAVQTYLTNPLGPTYDNSAGIIYVSDIYGLPLVQNKLLADSLAKTGYPVVFPDLFRGDAVPVGSPEAGLNLTEWRSRHPSEEIDSIIATTIAYMKKELGVKRVGGVGYCFGGKYVPRAMTGSGVDVGFIAHPSSLTEEEITGVNGPLSIAAGRKLSVSYLSLPFTQ